jgi:hypothetical protein
MGQNCTQQGHIATAGRHIGSGLCIATLQSDQKVLNMTGYPSNP